MIQFIITYGAVIILAFLNIISSVMGICQETKANNRRYKYKYIVILSLSIGLILASAIDYLTGINILGPYFAISVVVVLALYIYIAIHKHRNRKKR